MSWRIGVSTGVCIEHPILGVLDAIDASGVRGIEFSTPPHHFAPWQSAHVDAVAARLLRSPLVPVSMHAPFGGRLDLSDPDPHRLEDTLQTVLTTAQALSRLGGQVLVAHATDIARAGEDVHARLDRAAHSLRILTQGCKDLGLTLAIESQLPHLVGGHPDETGHTSLGRHWHRFVEVAGDRLVHVDAHDNHGQFDDHLPPGDGQISWHDIKSTLQQVRYTGWVILELKCPEEPLAGYFARAFEQAHRALNGGDRTELAS